MVLYVRYYYYCKGKQPETSPSLCYFSRIFQVGGRRLLMHSHEIRLDKPWKHKHPPPVLKNLTFSCKLMRICADRFANLAQVRKKPLFCIWEHTHGLFFENISVPVRGFRSCSCPSKRERKRKDKGHSWSASHDKELCVNLAVSNRLNRHCRIYRWFDDFWRQSYFKCVTSLWVGEEKLHLFSSI